MFTIFVYKWYALLAIGTSFMTSPDLSSIMSRIALHRRRNSSSGCCRALTSIPNAQQPITSSVIRWKSLKYSVNFEDTCIQPSTKYDVWYTTFTCDVLWMKITWPILKSRSLKNRFKHDLARFTKICDLVCDYWDISLKFEFNCNLFHKVDYTQIHRNRPLRGFYRLVGLINTVNTSHHYNKYITHKVLLHSARFNVAWFLLVWS